MIGTLLAGRYKLIRALGSGGFGQTYLAEDIRATEGQADHDGLCVVKQLQPASQTSNFLTVARRLFDTEVSTLETLGQHDQIPTLLDHFEEDNEFYLVQDFIDGQSLKEEFKAKGRFGEADVIDLLHQVLTILSFVHSQNVIHRDIKPDNLIRRHRDGKLVLIDFGAVKQIRTQLSGPSDTQLTVGIGTQGYTPCEQLAGKPRFSSDLYALGMTAIHALSGESPSDWVDDPETTPLQWPMSVSVSPGLEQFLRQLVQPSVYRRYGSAQAALADLNRLDQLVLEVDIPETVPDLRSSQKGGQPWWWRLAAPVMATALVFGVRQLGGFVPPELAVYDWLVYQQPDLGPDPRLLLVEITEADLQRLQRPTPTDATLAQAIDILQGYDPRVIGLDMHRELPQGDGHAQLLETLQAPNLVAIFSIGGTSNQALPPPDTVPSDRVGFNDIPVDSDGVIRRNLLFASASNEADAPVCITAFPYGWWLQVSGGRGH
ncbi:Serine/threonine-protein kinase [Halomicronema hongdechloris C2206]|uniref:non-specific serine/threonine protein kinase n=1 Tax=Halomicronema hongdechloris C2206 TaxID=1641165 RepID=A0A1Z3HND2_9CYAN|nr:CHASE2 domain-containing protein [Halomicronema hongdechloris]ASC71801.1 Serine/threonine-protein kinase [Halomicronema hongdechloris C2206]